MVCVRGRGCGVCGVSVCIGNTRTCCRHKRGRFESRHGGRFERTHGPFLSQHSQTQHHTETDRERERKDDERRERREETEKKEEKKAFSRAPEVACSCQCHCVPLFFIRKRTLEHVRSVMCCSKPLTFHNGFMFFCFSYLFQALVQISSPT